jgi:hypothetical protein
LLGAGLDTVECTKLYWKHMTAKYVYWRDGQHWLGYFEEFPDYLTQGDSLEQLEEYLRDLYTDLTSGQIPGIRRVAELSLTA